MSLSYIRGRVPCRICRVIDQTKTGSIIRREWRMTGEGSRLAANAFYIDGWHGTTLTVRVAIRETSTCSWTFGVDTMASWVAGNTSLQVAWVGRECTYHHLALAKPSRSDTRNLGGQMEARCFGRWMRRRTLTPQPWTTKK